MRRQGIDVVDLGAGEPDFSTPEHVKDAARAATAKGQEAAARADIATRSRLSLTPTA